MHTRDHLSRLIATRFLSICSHVPFKKPSAKILGWLHLLFRRGCGLQRRIVHVPFLSSTVKCVRIRHVEGCADLQPLWQVGVSQKRFAE